MKTVQKFFFGLVIAFISLVKAETLEQTQDGRIFKLNNLLQINVNLLGDLDDYIKALETKLQTINEALLDLSTYHINYESDMKSIVTSPVCSFSLIRHMKSDWTHWQLFLEADPGEDALESLHSKKKYLPTYEDLTEVCSGISSIINAYDLFPKDIARGLFSGVQLKSLMSPRDCVQMAAHSIDIQDFNMTVEWLQVAISMLGNPSLQDRFHTLFHLNATDLYFKLAEVYISQYLWLPALETVDDALKLQPRNAKLLVMEEHLSSRILLDLSPKTPYLNIRKNQHKLQKNKSLHCFYQRKKEHSFLLLTSLKAEIVFLDPWIVLYH